MILNSKRFICQYFGLPVDMKTCKLLSATHSNEANDSKEDVIYIKSDHEDSFLDKIGLNFETQFNGNSKKLNPTDKMDPKKRTRIYVIEGDEDAIFSKLKDLSLNTLILKSESEIWEQSKNGDINFYALNSLNHKEKTEKMIQIHNESKNTVSIKPKEDGCKLLREVEELSESVTSCIKLKGHPCSISHKYNKTTRRMNKVITCNYEGWGKQFTKSWNVLDHFKVHTGDRPYVCETWGRAFSQKGNLSKHTKLHTERKYHNTLCHSLQKITPFELLDREEWQRSKFNLKIILQGRMTKSITVFWIWFLNQL